MSEITTVVFDIGRVLIDFPWMDFVTELFHGDETVIKEVNEAMWGDGRWNELDRGVMNAEQVLNSFIAANPAREKEIRYTFDQVKKVIVRLPYARPWLQELRDRGYRVLYLSNYSQYVMYKNPAALDFLPLTDGGIFSCNVHLIKPDPAIYQKLCDTFRLKPQECVFLDDNKDNIASANAFGIHGLLFEGYEKTKAELDALLEEDRRG